MQSSYGLSEWASFGTVGQLAGFRERLFGAGVPIVKGGLVFPLTYHGGDLFWRSHILQQLADVGRAQDCDFQLWKVGLDCQRR